MVDRRQLIWGLAASSLWTSDASPAWTKADPVGRFGVEEPTETAWIIASLSPLGKTRRGVIRRETPYFAAVERWFARSVDHPAIAALGADFNLPRFVGNAADYRFGPAGQLVRATDATPLWDDPDGDLFTRHRPEIEDFARRSEARRFLRLNSPTLAASHNALHQAVDMRDITGWLETQFTERPAHVHVFVSPLTGGWNWTNLDGKRPRIWVPEPKPGSLDDPIKRFTTVSSVFTEVDHIYVNPVTKLHASAVETAFAKSKGWASDSAWADYESAELVFNEYMTWGVFLEYARQRLSSPDYDALATKIVRFMENTRGFVRFGDFVARLRRVMGKNTQRLQEAFPTIISSVG